MKNNILLPNTPQFRRATHEDFKALYEIWMQADVIPFLYFEEQSEEQFKSIFDNIIKESEIWVMEINGEVVATRRIIEGGILPSGAEHAHSVELCSFAVRKDYREKKLGNQFYEFFIKYINEKKPHIKRIEIGQDTDASEIARHLAEKYGFKIETIFTEWMKREKGSEVYKNKWYMGLRFMTLITDPEFANQSIAGVKKFTPIIPSLFLNNNLMNEIRIDIDKKNNTATCYYKNKRLGICTFTYGADRYKHIQFWAIKLDPDCNLPAMEASLRKLLIDASPNCKKIELYVAHQEIADLVQKLGFHYHGTRIGAYKSGDKYFNELGVDFNFCNFVDAKTILDLQVTEAYQKIRVSSALNQCQKAIEEALKENKIDRYGALYLENLAFQMVRDGLGEPAIRAYGQKDQEPPPWNALLQELPDRFKKDFIHLDKLTTKTYVDKPTQEFSNVNLIKTK